MTWRYQIVKTRSPVPGGGTEDTYGVHEVYTDPERYTERGVTLDGYETAQELRDALVDMLVDTRPGRFPILDKTADVHNKCWHVVSPEPCSFRGNH